MFSQGEGGGQGSNKGSPCRVGPTRRRIRHGKVASMSGPTSVWPNPTSDPTCELGLHKGPDVGLAQPDIGPDVGKADMSRHEPTLDLTFELKDLYGDVERPSK